MMQKLVMLAMSLLLVSSSHTHLKAQQQGPPKERPTIEQRTEKVMGTLNKELSLSMEQLVSTRTIFTDFFKSMDAIMEASQGQRPEKGKIEALEKKRDDALFKILTSNQHNTYLKIKDQLRPPHEKPQNKN